MNLAQRILFPLFCLIHGHSPVQVTGTDIKIERCARCFKVLSIT